MFEATPKDSKYSLKDHAADLDKLIVPAAGQRARARAQRPQLSQMMATAQVPNYWQTTVAKAKPFLMDKLDAIEARRDQIFAEIEKGDRKCQRLICSRQQM